MNDGLYRAKAALLSWLQNHPRHVIALVSALALGTGGAAFAVANFGPDASSLPVRTVLENVDPVPLQWQTEALERNTVNLYRTDATRSSDSFESLLKRLGIDDPAAAAYLRSDNLARQNLLGRAGRMVTAEATAEHRLLRLSVRWSQDDTSENFNRLVIARKTLGFTSQLESAPMSRSTRLASGTVYSSLFAATDDAHIPDSVATQLADIFSSEIDFHRALRKGDQFSVVYETLEADGEPLRAGRVLSAEFNNDGKIHSALWFQDKGAAKGAYYSFKGESLHHAYLASPLAFSRVTSGFSMRFHPILQTWKKHLGVDYGAPIGTPVRAVADGVVEFAGQQNGYGNVIIVRHANNHSTLYGHLSRINVRRGQQVAQSDNIGAVGMTGWATGPHLHFEFRINGQHVDPLTLAQQVQVVPISTASRPAFTQYAAQMREALDAAAQVQLTSVQ